MPNTKLAAPELTAIQIEGMTRSTFMVRGALAAGAVYGTAAVGPFVKEAIAQQAAQEGGGDVDILNFALTLEYLESAFYEMAGKQVKGLKGDVKELTAQLAKDEKEHVDFLTSAISDAGGQPTKAPAVDFADAFKDEMSFLKLAQTFEDTGVSAYNGAGPALQNKDFLSAAGTIVQIEARHAALIRLQNGEDFAPAAFDETLEQEEVLQAVMPFVKS